VGRLVLRVGWGMVLVIAQEIVAHLLNAAAWRFAFFTDQAVAFSFLELVKLRVAGDDNRPFEAIWWRGVEETEQTPVVNQRLDLAYELEANRWNGDIKLQLNVKDLKTVNSK